MQLTRSVDQPLPEVSVRVQIGVGAKLDTYVPSIVAQSRDGPNYFGTVIHTLAETGHNQRYYSVRLVAA